MANSFLEASIRLVSALSFPWLSQIRLWLWLAACSLDGSQQVLLCSVVRLKMHSQLARNSKSVYLYNQVEFALIANLLLKFFLSFLQPEWLPCVKNWCGLNDHCAMDPIHPQHHWCLCRIGTDEHGNCVGEQCLIYSTIHLFNSGQWLCCCCCCCFSVCLVFFGAKIGSLNLLASLSLKI